MECGRFHAACRENLRGGIIQRCYHAGKMCVNLAFFSFSSFLSHYRLLSRDGLESICQTICHPTFVQTRFSNREFRSKLVGGGGRGDFHRCAASIWDRKRRSNCESIKLVIRARSFRSKNFCPGSGGYRDEIALVGHFVVYETLSTTTDSLLNFCYKCWRKSWRIERNKNS